MPTDTVWYTRCPLPTAFSLAVRLGWLDEALGPAGTTVRSLATSTDPRVRQAHFDQDLPAFFRHGGNVPPLVSRSRGVDVRLIGLSWASHAQVLLALPGSGVTSAEDLRGRRLSLPRRPGASIDFWYATVLRAYDRALASAGLGRDDVELVEVEVGRTFVADATSRSGARDTLWDARYLQGFQREEAAALVRGEVDVLFAEGGIAATLQGTLGAEVVVDLSTGPDEPVGVNNGTPAAFTVTGDLVDRDPDVVDEVVLQTLRAVAWARERPEDARRIVAAESGIPEDLVDVASSARVSDELDVTLDAVRLDALAEQAAHLDRLGLLAAPVDLDAFVERGPLERAGVRLGAAAPGEGVAA